MDKSFNTLFPQDVAAFFTDNAEDFILPPEARGFSVGQKNTLWTKYRIMPEKVFILRQVHGNKVLAVFSGDVPQQGDLPEADAVVTNVPGIFLSIRTADCLPVFLCDPQKKCIGLAHAGWKGTNQKIVVKTVEALERYYGSNPKDILVEFGPAIRECCYEVGPEFEKTFPE